MYLKFQDQIFSACWLSPYLPYLTRVLFLRKQKNVRKYLYQPHCSKSREGWKCMLFQDAYHSSKRENPSPFALMIFFYYFFQQSKNVKQTTKYTHKRCSPTPSLPPFSLNEAGHKNTIKELGFYIPVALEQFLLQQLCSPHCSTLQTPASQTRQPTLHFPREQLFLLEFLSVPGGRSSAISPHFIR